LPALLLAFVPAFAHDLWLLPEKDGGGADTVRIQAVVGAHFPKGEETKKAADYRDARWQRAGEIRPTPDFGAEPMLLGRIPGKEGFYVSVVGPTREIDLKQSEAREYLRDEVGLEGKELEAMLAGPHATLHETYSRLMKILVLPQSSANPPEDVLFGLPLEIELLELRPVQEGGRELRFRLMAGGKAVGGAFFRVVTAEGKTLPVRADAGGGARARVPARGPILIAHVQVSGKGEGTYETRWSNLAVYERP
jgi:hypothetical protein